MTVSRHISFEERQIIANMLSCKEKNFTLQDIGYAINKSKGAVHKEIIKNGIIKAAKSRVVCKNPFNYYRNYKYSAKSAHDKYQKRFLSAKYITKFKLAIQWINNNIEYDRSMYEMQQLFIEAYPNEPVPSESTLYYYWHKGLIRYKNGRAVRKKVPKGATWFKDDTKVSIDERPDFINDKTEFGHWEIDTVVDGNKKGGVITFNERATRKYYAIRVEDKKGFTAFNVVEELIAEIGIENIKSITSDNGTEFSHHMRITNLYNIPWYFCHPYCSSERGQNEHLNGELRFYYPKGTSFYNKTQIEIDKIVLRINNKIRKALDGNTSNKLFSLLVNI